MCAPNRRQVAMTRFAQNDGREDRADPAQADRAVGQNAKGRQDSTASACSRRLEQSRQGPKRQRVTIEHRDLPARLGLYPLTELNKFVDSQAKFARMHLDSPHHRLHDVDGN